MKLTKKILAMLMAVVLAFSLAACAGGDTNDDNANKDVKVGVILIGDETEGYSKAHMDGIKAAAQKLGIADNAVIWKYKVAEDQTCYDAASDLVSQGCNVVFSNSYGHQTYIAQVAEEYKDVTFVSMTGDFAAISGLSNFKNAFTKVFESRYISGVAAGAKLEELVQNGTLSPDKTPENYDKDGNIKVGYVGAFNFAEVVSGYTSFYLGIKSVVPNVVMEVNYTNSWFDIAAEGAAAESLIANGCVIIGQHADSTGAPAATEKLNGQGKICYSVGYNIDMLETAPNAALTSATNNWVKYYEYAIGNVMKGEEVAANWAEGYAKDAVAITDLSKNCAEGTAQKVEAAIAGLKDGSVNVFDTSKFTVDGKTVTTEQIDLSYYDFSSGEPKLVYEGETKEAIVDGVFQESTLRAAPYFSLRIDGITENS